MCAAITRARQTGIQFTYQRRIEAAHPSSNHLIGRQWGKYDTLLLHHPANAIHWHCHSHWRWRYLNGVSSFNTQTNDRFYISCNRSVLTHTRFAPFCQSDFVLQKTFGVPLPSPLTLLNPVTKNPGNCIKNHSIPTVRRLWCGND